MFRRLTILAVLLALASAVQAQSGTPGAPGEAEVIGPVSPDRLMGPLPVDQGVGDLDPLSRSLRRLEPGNAMHSNRVRITQMRDAEGDADPALPGGYRYSAPGVQALFDRPDYLVRTGPGRNDIGRNVAPAVDGAITERVPAGTVYDLRPQAALRHLMPSMQTDAPADWQDTRIDSRYRIDGQLGPASSGQAIDRHRYPHIPSDTEVPSRLPRRFDPDEPAAE